MPLGPPKDWVRFETRYWSVRLPLGRAGEAWHGEHESIGAALFHRDPASGRGESGVLQITGIPHHKHVTDDDLLDFVDDVFAPHDFTQDAFLLEDFPHPDSPPRGHPSRAVPARGGSGLAARITTPVAVCHPERESREHALHTRITIPAARGTTFPEGSC